MVNSKFKIGEVVFTTRPGKYRGYTDIIESTVSGICTDNSLSWFQYMLSCDSPTIMIQETNIFNSLANAIKSVKDK